MEIVLRQLAGSSLSDDELKSIIAKARSRAGVVQRQMAALLRGFCPCMLGSGLNGACTAGAAPRRPIWASIAAYLLPINNVAGDAQRGGRRARSNLPRVQGSA